MIAKVKTALRITHNMLDTDIEDCINACFADMHRVGVRVYSSDGTIDSKVESDPLIVQAVKLYARWICNYENQADRYRIAYERLRDSLSLDGDHNVH